MPGSNPYDSAATDLFSGQAAIGARAAVSSVADRNPDAEAQVQRQAQSLGVPYESARNNPAIITQRAAAGAVDYDNLARVAPTTTRYLSNPANAAVSHDDVGVLGNIENWFGTTGSYLGQKFVSGLHSAMGVGAQALNDVYSTLGNIGATQSKMGLGNSGIQSNPLAAIAIGAYNALSPEARLRGDRIANNGLQRFAVGQQQTSQRIGQRADQDAGEVGQQLTLSSLVTGKTQPVPLEYFTTDPDKAAYLHPLKILGDALQGAPALAALLGTSALTDGTGGAFAIGGYMGTGQQLDTLTNLGDAEVKKSPAFRALINAGVKPSDALLYVRNKTASDEGIASGVANTALAGLLEPFAGKTGGSLWKAMGLDSMTWGAMGGASQLGSNLVEKADVNPDKSPFEGVGEALVSNLFQGALFSGVTHATGHAVLAERRTAQATETHEALKELTDLATASKLRERAPDNFHDLVADMAEGSPAENVYVHPDKMTEALDALHQGEIEPEQMAKIENVVGPKLKDAIEQGTDVELPIADYAAHLAGTGADKVLLDHLKVDPSGMTKAEADEFMATKGEELKGEIDKALGQVREEEATSGEIGEVRSKVLDQLNQANRFTPKVNERYADLHAAFYSTLANRLGISPKELYDRFPIRISNSGMQADSHFAQRYDDLLSNIGKKPGKAAGGNDNSEFPGVTGPAGERLADLKPPHERYQEGDVLSYKGETGRVTSANEKAVTLKTKSGDHIVPRDHPDLKVAPLHAWADEYHQSEAKPIFYSELERAVEGSKQAKASGQQWLATLAKTAGVKKEEIEWTELPEWLATQDGPVTREELLAFVREGGVQVEEVDQTPSGFDEDSPEYGVSQDFDYDENGSETEKWNLVDSEGRIHLSFDNWEDAQQHAEDWNQIARYEEGPRDTFQDYTEPGGEDYHELLLTLPPGVRGNPERGPSTHFDEPGVVAHLRFKTRQTTDGKRTLFIEEVQSDWHQKGRDQGYEGDRTEEEKNAVREAYSTALGQVESKGEAFAKVALTALENELSKRPEIPEPTTPYVTGDKDATELLDLIHRVAAQGNETALRVQASWLRTQNADRPRALEIAHYATEMSKVISRQDLQVKVERLRRDVADYRGDSMGRSAKNAVMNVYWPDDVPDDVKTAMADFNDAELRANEARQAEEHINTGIPDAPFKATWPALVMKRAIRWAADNGFEAVAWTTGDQQRERYNLAQSVGPIEATKVSDGYRIHTRQNANVIRTIIDRGLGEFPSDDVGRGGVMMKPEQILEVFGKDLGTRMILLADAAPEIEDKITRHPDGSYTATYTKGPAQLQGDDLKIGGEGMNAFYDRNLVNITNGILKKLGGGKVEMLPVESGDEFEYATDENDEPLETLAKGGNPGFHITPGMAQHAREGFALFQKNRGAYSPATDTISLLEHADLSTFLHESGHFFLETYSRLVTQGDAPAPIKQDFDAFLKWADVKDANTWADMTLEQRREAHEKFARAFESYLFTGRAPAPGLRDLFRTFRSWLVAVYRHVTNLGAKPTPEIAQVMDRMLASDEEVKQAQEARSMEPLFADQASSGMSEDQWRDYQRTNATATEEAQSTLTARSLRDLKWLDNARSKEVNRLQRQAQDIRKATRAQVESEVASEPVYRAQRFLKRGEVDGEQSPLGTPHRLNIADVDALGHTPETKAKLGYGKYGMLGEEGLHPDEVADRFGFSSGDHLIKSLTEAEPFKDRVSGLTEQRLLEEHGDLVDPQSINEAASEAVHNEFRARAVATELAALAKATGKPQLLAQAAKQFASETIARTRIRDLKPAKFEAAAARAGKAAMQALAKGDHNLAALEKRNQLFNTYATKAAQDALREVQQAVARFNRLQRPAAQANMRGPFRQQLAALLDRFDLRSSVPLKASAEPLKPLNEWVQDEAERLSAVLPAIPDFILNPGFKTHYRALTIEQMRGLTDTVKQIEMLARREQKQYLAIRGMAFDDERTKLLDQIRRSYPDAFNPDTGNPHSPRPDFVPSVGKALGKTGDKFLGEFLSTETLASMLDGGGKGSAHDSLFGRMSERSDWKSQQMGEIAKDFKPLFKQWSLLEKRAYARKGYFIDSIGTSMTRENMLVTALHAGNSDGRQRLNNYGWTDAHIDDITGHLDERDWKLADAIWRLFDEKLWPQLYDLNMRTRGVAPPKVEPFPYQTKFGMARGGYFRLKYDTELDERAHRMDEGQQVKELLGGTLGMGGARTAQGTSIERVDNVTMRPRLDLGVFSETVNETVHDLAYREAVADSMRVLNDTQVQAALKGSLGTPAYRAFVNHIRDVAAPPRNPLGWIEKGISVARRNTIINMMSGVVTALVHIHGIVPAFTRVDTGLMAAEIAKSFWLPHIFDRYKFASQTSRFMAERTTNLDRDMAKGINQLTMKGKLMPGSEVFLGLMTHIHKAIDAIVWNAAFKEGMKLNANDSDAAVAHADHIVRQTQGSGRDVDLPSIMAGHGGWGELKKAFTMFSSYFNSQLQLLVQSGAVARQEARDNPAAASAKFAAKFMLVSVIPGLLYEALFSGDQPDDNEDGESKLVRYLHAVVDYNAGFIPLLRDVVPEVWAQFDHAEPDYGYKISPLQSAGEAVFQKAPHSAVKAAHGKATAQDVHNLIVGAGFLTGTPGKLVADTLSGIDAWAKGERGPEAMVVGPNHARKARHF